MSNRRVGVGLGIGAGVLVATLWLLGVESTARGDTGHTSMTSLDERGTVVHVVPRPHASVRMQREMVVLVPFFHQGRAQMTAPSAKGRSGSGTAAVCAG